MTATRACESSHLEFFGFFPASARRAKRSYPSAMLNMICLASGSDISAALARASEASALQRSAASSVSDGTVSPSPESTFALNVRLLLEFPRQATRSSRGNARGSRKDEGGSRNPIGAGTLQNYGQCNEVAGKRPAQAYSDN